MGHSGPGGGCDRLVAWARRTAAGPVGGAEAAGEAARVSAVGGKGEPFVVVQLVSPLSER